MATRSLTDEFVTLRAERRQRRDPSEPRSRRGSHSRGLLEEVELGAVPNPMTVRDLTFMVHAVFWKPSL